MSEVRADLISNRAGDGPAPLRDQWASKAWVNFNGSGTVAVRQSGNVSSITDNGTGDYAKNLTAAQADANYAVYVNASRIGLNDAAAAACWVSSSDTRSTSSKRIRTAGISTSLAVFDPEDVYAAIVR